MVPGNRNGARQLMNTKEMIMKRSAIGKTFAIAAIAALFAMPTGALALTFTTIDVPGASSTLPNFINPQGDIVGLYSAGGTDHGFLLHQGTFTPLTSQVP